MVITGWWLVMTGDLCLKYNIKLLVIIYTWKYLYRGPFSRGVGGGGGSKQPLPLRTSIHTHLWEVVHWWWWMQHATLKNDRACSFLRVVGGGADKQPPPLKMSVYAHFRGRWEVVVNATYHPWKRVHMLARKGGAGGGTDKQPPPSKTSIHAHFRQ